MKKVLKIIGLLVGGLVLIFLFWGLVEPYTVDTQAYPIALPHLSPSLEGVRAAVISDFQVGFWLDNVATVRRIIQQIIEEDPDLVLILGDFIYHGGENAPERIALAADLVSPLAEHNLPVYAVLGNHDYSVAGYHPTKIDAERAQNLTAALEAVGVIVLENESRIFRYQDSGELYIVGIGAHMIRNDHPQQAFEDVPEDAPRLVLMHNPTSFGKVGPGLAPLAAAGHTHGGQLRIPFTPQWSIVTYFVEEDVHFDGWIADYGQPGNQLYVNRGIGMSLLPLRFACPPEITYFTLVSEPQP
jgi:hypothetical protein